MSSLNSDLTTPEAEPDERAVEAALRPRTLDEVIGQQRVRGPQVLGHVPQCPREAQSSLQADHHQVERIGYGETDSGYGAGRTSVKGRVIDGELVAKSVADSPSPFNVGDRVFHQKFGNGNVRYVEGNKLVVDFDHAGEKNVVDSFVARV